VLSASSEGERLLTALAALGARRVRNAGVQFLEGDAEAHVTADIEYADGSVLSVDVRLEVFAGYPD